MPGSNKFPDYLLSGQNSISGPTLIKKQRESYTYIDQELAKISVFAFILLYFNFVRKKVVLTNLRA